MNQSAAISRDLQPFLLLLHSTKRASILSLSLRQTIHTNTVRSRRTAFEHHGTCLRVERIFMQRHRTRKRRRHPKTVRMCKQLQESVFVTEVSTLTSRAGGYRFNQFP